jgi:hypothetical protein
VCLRLIRRDAHCVIGQETNDIPPRTMNPHWRRLPHLPA